MKINAIKLSTFILKINKIKNEHCNMISLKIMLPLSKKLILPKFYEKGSFAYSCIWMYITPSDYPYIISSTNSTIKVYYDMR